MPVSGLVLTLSSEPPLRDAALRALHAHASIETGNAERHRLPIVVDTPTSDEDKAIWEWLHELPGVLFVDLVCTDQSEDEPAAGRPSSDTPPLEATAGPPGSGASLNDSHSHHARGGRTGQRS